MLDFLIAGLSQQAFEPTGIRFAVSETSAVLEIPYVTIIPYPFAVVLDQYFDFEHVAHVHPTSLGEYVLVENTGKRIARG